MLLLYIGTYASVSNDSTEVLHNLYSLLLLKINVSQWSKEIFEIELGTGPICYRTRLCLTQPEYNPYCGFDKSFSECIIFVHLCLLYSSLYEVANWQLAANLTLKLDLHKGTIQETSDCNLVTSI